MTAILIVVGVPFALMVLLCLAIDDSHIGEGY